ncbi:MAG: F0F1 ATP synthase subunit A [Thermodesulfobacteriota bacterium]
MGSSRLKILLFFFIPVIILFVIGLVFGPLGSSFLGKEPPNILKVPRPHVALPAEPIAHIGSFSITNTLIASWFTILVLVGLSIFLTRKMKLIPDRRQGLAEVIVEGLLNFVESVADKKNARMIFPGVATIFIYVIFNAYLALLPFFGTIGMYHHAHGHDEFIAFFRAANTDVNVPLSIALMSFFFVESWGMRVVGVTRYLSEFINVRQFLQGLKEIFTGKIKTGPMNIVFGFISLFVGVLEIFSHLTRMLSFTFRLFGNMTAGEILILVSCFLIPLVFTIPFYGLELLIGMIQALIFSGLTLVFGTIAVSPHEESHE